jgi:acetolactate synthase-1/2/3 large subunit
MVKLSDYVVGFIADLGVRHLFMLNGGGAMHLND